MKSYDPKNWYWFVGGDQSRAFSSAAGDYVQAADATFAAWQADGNVPTIIDTEANLGAVLAPYFIRPANAAVLDGYQVEQATNILGKAAFKVLFNHENRIRALEGRAALTQPQALAAVKALM
jgi:hypothetical protein